MVCAILQVFNIGNIVGMCLKMKYPFNLIKASWLMGILGF